MRLISAVSGVQVPAPPPFLFAQRMQLLALRFSRTIRRHRLLPAGRRVLSRLSGGAGLGRAAAPPARAAAAGSSSWPAWRTSIISFAERMRRTTKRSAARWPHRWTSSSTRGRGDVAERARIEKRSIEDAARGAALRVSSGSRERLDADAIAVGHTLDDQAETFLLRLIRGAGTRGLAGIRPTGRRVIRPLIEVRRRDLRDYVRGERDLLIGRTRPTPISRFRAIGCATSSSRISSGSFRRESSRCWRGKPRSRRKTKIDCSRSNRFGRFHRLNKYSRKFTVDASAFRRAPSGARCACRAAGAGAPGAMADSSDSTTSSGSLRVRAGAPPTGSGA